MWGPSGHIPVVDFSIPAFPANDSHWCSRTEHGLAFESLVASEIGCRGVGAAMPAAWEEHIGKLYGDAYQRRNEPRASCPAACHCLRVIALPYTQFAPAMSSR